jgi:hypothetical protein
MGIELNHDVLCDKSLLFLFLKIVKRFTAFNPVVSRLEIILDSRVNNAQLKILRQRYQANQVQNSSLYSVELVESLSSDKMLMITEELFGLDGAGLCTLNCYYDCPNWSGWRNVAIFGGAYAKDIGKPLPLAFSRICLNTDISFNDDINKVHNLFANAVNYDFDLLYEIISDEMLFANPLFTVKSERGVLFYGDYRRIREYYYADDLSAYLQKHYTYYWPSYSYERYSVDRDLIKNYKPQYDISMIQHCPDEVLKSCITDCYNDKDHEFTIWQSDSVLIKQKYRFIDHYFERLYERILEACKGELTGSKN